MFLCIIKSRSTIIRSIPYHLYQREITRNDLFIIYWLQITITFLCLLNIICFSTFIFSITFLCLRNIKFVFFQQKNFSLKFFDNQRDN
jgi:hypothetical protein